MTSLVTSRINRPGCKEYISHTAKFPRQKSKHGLDQVEVDEEMMHAPEEMEAAEAGDVAVALMQVLHHLESETFSVKSWTLFLSRGRDFAWSSPRGWCLVLN